MSHDANGNGHGTLASHDGTSFAADWTLDCVMEDETPVNTLMTMQVDAAYNFSIALGQDGTSALVGADGPAVMTRFQNPDAGRQASTSQVHALDAMRMQDKKLLDEIITKEAEIADFPTFADSLPMLETWELTPQGWIMIYDDMVPDEPSEYDEPSAYRERVTPLAVLIIICSLIGLFALVRLHKRRRSDRKRCSFRARMTNWKERRARRKAKKQAVKAFMRNLWAQLTERPSVEHHHHHHLDEKQVVESSMDDEIKQFRQAVDVVDSIVAAEEGRSTHNEAFVDLDETLPPYEACQETDELLPTVADGFRKA